ncbi:hypothetical protein A9Q84_12540 [Halobacteriovorax marinus]|uniref:Lipoprotein n=1 Tax=Halobacteriovorax marinus TaxID=97084 RepID=A0A1Y5F8B9_9BACT|nr:hypothetical protein A9Q84_12540 [Halobacteriovorax marinus]
MKNTLIETTKKSLLALTVLATLASCGGGGGGGGGGSTSTYGAYNSSFATAQGFVNGLNDVDGFSDNELVKDIYDTDRSDWDAEDYFVIYDAEYEEYVAVSLQYIRTITYYDYYSSNFNLATEFRDIQDDHDFFDGLIGDGFGDDYEIVDYEYTDTFGEDHYRGFDSDGGFGYLYEDADATTDVSLMASDKEKSAFFKKAADVSIAYSIDMKTSLSLVTLGSKVEKMLDRSSGDQLTEEDQLALVTDIEKVTGASFSDFNEATSDATAKEDLVATIAAKLGTTADNLENRLLPELFGIEL